MVVSPSSVWLPVSVVPGTMDPNELVMPYCAQLGDGVAVTVGVGLGPVGITRTTAALASGVALGLTNHPISCVMNPGVGLGLGMMTDAFPAESVVVVPMRLPSI